MNQLSELEQQNSALRKNLEKANDLSGRLNEEIEGAHKLLDSFSIPRSTHPSGAIYSLYGRIILLKSLSDNSVEIKKEL